MSTSTDWLESERQDLAVQRILETAAEVVPRDGFRRPGRVDFSLERTLRAL